MSVDPLTRARRAKGPTGPAVGAGSTHNRVTFSGSRDYHARMLKVFEVHLVPGGDPSTILSEDTLRETQAQVMTLAEARAVGFQGMPDPPPGQEICLIAVAARDAKWIQRSIEQSEATKGFNVHDAG